MSTGVVSIRLSDELKNRLDALSEVTGRPAAFYVRQALAEHLDDLEWAYGIAAKAEAVRSGSGETVPFEDALAELDITREELDAMPDEAE